MATKGSAWAKELENYDGKRVFKARLNAAGKKAAKPKAELVRRAAFADGAIRREKLRKAVFYPSGSLIRVTKLPGYEQFEGEKRGVRGKIRGFTRKSRLAFLETVAKLDRRAECPKFVTLTYPAEYPDFFTAWKEDLHYFSIYLQRQYPGAAFIWKLEPQQRGAPHFHLLLWGVPHVDKEWLSRTWYEIVGSHDDRHLRAGTRIEYVRSWNGVMSYAGKNYMGKECGRPGNWPEFTGRFWGVYGRQKLPVSERIAVTFTARGLARVHRLMRKYFRSKGIEWKTGGGVRLFSSNFRVWMRAFEWAELGQTLDKPFGEQPF